MCLLSSCSTQKDQNSDVISIHPDEFINTPEKGTDWIETVKFIAFETKGTHFIPDDAKTKFRDDYILFGNFDRILIFSSEGKFINEIFKKGGGPTEYRFIADFDLVSGKDEIVIVGQKSLIFYSLDGTFIERHPLKFRSWSIAAINSDRFAFNLGRGRMASSDSVSKHQLIITDRRGNITQRKFEFPYVTLFDDLYNTFRKSADSEANQFTLYYDLSVYEINNKAELIQKYLFDFSPYNPDTSFLQSSDLENDPKPFRHNEGKFTKLRNFYETENTLVVQVGSDKRQKMAFQFINRKSGNQMTLVMDDNHNIGQIHGWPISTPLGSGSGWFLRPHSALDAIEIYESLKPEQKKKLSDFEGFKELSQLKENDNTVYFLFKVKDF